MSNINQCFLAFVAMAMAFGISVPMASAQQTGSDIKPIRKNQRATSDVVQRRIKQMRDEIRKGDQRSAIQRRNAADTIRLRNNQNRDAIGRRVTPEKPSDAKRILRSTRPDAQRRMPADDTLRDITNTRIADTRPLYSEIHEPVPAIRSDAPIRPEPKKRPRKNSSDDTRSGFTPAAPTSELGRHRKMADDATDSDLGRPAANRGLADRSDVPTTLRARFNANDVQLYDNVFGQFNPLRSNSGTGSDNREMRQPGLRVAPATRFSGAARPATDLAVKIDSAIRQRRTEISLIRDAAIEQADPQRMKVAEQMETRLNTFVRAQQLAREKAAAQASETARRR